MRRPIGAARDGPVRGRTAGQRFAGAVRRSGGVEEDRQAQATVRWNHGAVFSLAVVTPKQRGRIATA